MLENPTEKKGDLRVWWIPQVPGKPFHVTVKSVDEAKLLLRTLADYDLFQFEHHIKPDYCNAGGLEEFDGQEWCEWYNEDGDDIDLVMDNEEESHVAVAPDASVAAGDETGPRGLVTAQ